MDEPSSVNVMDNIIHQSDTNELFSVVVSNPPYQELVSEWNHKSHPVWDVFVEASSMIAEKACFVTPARWMSQSDAPNSSAKFYEVKKLLFKERFLVSLTTFSSVFVFGKSVGITGGLSVKLLNFLQPKISFSFIEVKNDKTNFIGALNHDDCYDFLLSPIDHIIVMKILEANVGNPMTESLFNCGHRKTLKTKAFYATGNDHSDYGVRPRRVREDTNLFVKPHEKVDGVEYAKVYHLEKGTLVERFVNHAEIIKDTVNVERLGSWQLCFTRSNPSALHKRHVVVSEPYSLTTDSWMGRNFPSRQNAVNFHSYLSTAFYRYLLKLKATGVSVLANAHSFVPDLDKVVNPRTGLVGYDSDWTDEDLKEVFFSVLTTDDWSHIEASVTG